MHIAIIGAGAAGLSAIRHTIQANFECTAFEQTGEIGGTWVYRDEVGVDRFGIPVHTSMYEGLRTNLPKEVMGFPDFPMKDGDISYLPQQDVLNFLENFAQTFDLYKHIKFYNHVKSIKPIENNRWELTSINLQTKEITVYQFDAVMVCNGHYHKPRYAQLDGIEKFKGIQKHSHDYRKAKEFQDQRVVIIGAGPSGVDLAYHISKAAKKVILSHHLKDPIETQFPEHVIQLPDIKEVKEYSVIFKDGSEEEIDVIFYCTGYEYSFPFLSEECGIIVDDNYVQPLYKHLINIEHPTMAIVGLPFYVCAFIMFDLQVRFFLKYLTNPKDFPTKQEMMEDTQKDIEQRRARGLTARYYHSLGTVQDKYFKTLTDLIGMEETPPVIFKIYKDRAQRSKTYLQYYRGDNYCVLNSEKFTVSRSTTKIF
ncbi:senecionine N-oxygenase-like isoform X1 [Chrysoperla carnea]|uniref:senecionine N-oxygenase-like isoform X1 n=1 Tax=Chrysoperla carnea TaxID=189513 RepID=UPI001D083AB5|nr:senecionine N-oxygenase-like isoform X1 [Chrysoperla carnea]XP_044729017.1 senecionine N-oxygenase-like isoform X1 [Chrysoperla carnea]XP_044729018.1 senecionine N-oxygenase-like isoform X1 [Chrysoperla carnea]